jgi:WD40 repeat protein
MTDESGHRGETRPTQCPHCGSFNPPGTLRCVCGLSFGSPSHVDQLSAVALPSAGSPKPRFTRRHPALSPRQLIALFLAPIMVGILLGGVLGVNHLVHVLFGPDWKSRATGHVIHYNSAEIIPTALTGFYFGLFCGVVFDLCVLVARVAPQRGSRTTSRALKSAHAVQPSRPSIPRRHRRLVRVGSLLGVAIALVTTLYFVFWFDSRLVRRFKEHTDPINSVALSPDGSLAASAGSGKLYKDYSVRLWDTQTGSLLHSWSHDGPVTSVLFSHDGSFLVAGGEDATVRVYSVRDKAILRRFQVRYQVFGGLKPEGKAPIISVALSADDKILVAASGEEFMVTGSSRVWVWDLETGREYPGFNGHPIVSAVAISPDGQYGLASSYDAVELWETATGKAVREFPRSGGPISCVAFSQDGETAVAAVRSEYNVTYGRVIRLWDVKTGVEHPKFEGHSGDVLSIAMSHDGRRLLVGGPDGTIRLWDIKGGRELTRYRNGAAVTSVALSGDGRFFISSCEESIKLWSMPD